MSLKCAVYARKSTDDSDRASEARSTTHQIEQCAALIERQGWTLADGHTYVDEATSGAVFNRPGLLRFMEAVRAKPRPFDVLVTYIEDRLGRDVIETGYLAKQIIDAGVRIVFADGSERKLGTATDALLMSISNFGAAFERERASIRVRDKMFAKAKAGHVTGLPPFGYSIFDVGGHKELRINEARAQIVRWIFGQAAEGFGCRVIAHRLNELYPGVLKWASTRVRDILRNQVYVGVVVFGTTKGEIRNGAPHRVAVPEAEWVRVEHHELRIIPQALWDAVQARKAATFATYLRGAKGRLSGKPERSALASQYLLAGMLPVWGLQRPSGRGHPAGAPGAALRVLRLLAGARPREDLLHERSRGADG
jgi:DNA invertase Pin-like site-specific DNA recombinase